MSPLPNIKSFPGLPAEQRAEILDTLFEPSTQLHTLSVSSLHDNTFPNYKALIATVKRQLQDLQSSSSTSDKEWLEAILASHPRLGEKKVDSEQSRKEQEQLQGSQEEANRLKKLNADYESAFLGLRYVVFVNGRTRDAIMQDMRRRIERADANQERTDAIEAICDIALDRAGKLGEEPEA